MSRRNVDTRPFDGEMKFVPDRHYQANDGSKCSDMRSICQSSSSASLAAGPRMTWSKPSSSYPCSRCLISSIVPTRQLLPAWSYPVHRSTCRTSHIVLPRPRPDRRPQRGCTGARSGQSCSDHGRSPRRGSISRSSRSHFEKSRHGNLCLERLDLLDTVAELTNPVALSTPDIDQRRVYTGRVRPVRRCENG